MKWKPFGFCLLVGALMPGPTQAQASAFEVASIKTAVDPGPQPRTCLVPCVPGERFKVDASRVDIRFMTLTRLILMAYRLKPYQLSGPDWMRDWMLASKFDILAKIPEGVSKDLVPEMLQALLAERFKLAIHRENKEMQVLALVVGKNGAKLQVSTAEADTFVPDPALTTPPGDPYGPLRITGRRWELLKVTMPGMAQVLTTFVGRPVIDMTNLKGNYRVAWDDPPAPAPVAGQAPSDMLDAVNKNIADAITAALEKAGLKLEPRKSPVEIVVVDRLEKTPTEN
jgi:uncharacterized protein (TIGR03435 family)